MAKFIKISDGYVNLDQVCRIYKEIFHSPSAGEYPTYRICFGGSVYTISREDYETIENQINPKSYDQL